MAVSKVLERWSFEVQNALGALTAAEKQFRIVTLSSTSTLSLATSASGALFILEDTPKEKEFGTVVCAGVGKVKLASEVKAGELVSSNNTGEGQVAKTGQFVLGMALVTGAAGSYVPVLVHPGSGVKL
jgi:hypothetical protein